MKRDNALLWWLLIASSAVTYLIADGRSPDTWHYADWLKFAAAMLAATAAKLSSSPLPHSGE